MKTIIKIKKYIDKNQVNCEPILPRIKSYLYRIKKEPKQELKLFVFNAERWMKRKPMPSFIPISMAIGCTILLILSISSSQSLTISKESMNSVHSNSDFCQISKTGERCIEKIKLAEIKVNDPERRAIIDSYSKDKNVIGQAFNLDPVYLMRDVLIYDLDKEIEAQPGNQELKDNKERVSKSIDIVIRNSEESATTLKLQLFSLFILPSILWIVSLVLIRVANKKLNKNEIEAYKQISEKLDSKRKEGIARIFLIKKNQEDSERLEEDTAIQ